MRVYYRKEMVAKSRKRSSPSAAKPELVIKDWIAHNLDLEIKKPFPLAKKDFYKAHDQEYVDGIFAGTISNGFGDTEQDVINSLPYTNGAIVHATLYALKTNENAAALCSGFHHAGYNFGGGYCTFNGLLIAALKALEAGAKKVGICDLDEHFSNGGEDIIKRLHLEDRIKHFTSGAVFHAPCHAEVFLEKLPDIVKSFYDCDVLIFQAGGDQYEKDPLGGIFTLEQLRERDRIVFQTARAMRLPVAWVLAGGYSDTSTILSIHRATAEECIKAESK